MNRGQIKNIKLSIFFLVSILLSSGIFSVDELKINSPNYFEEQNNVYEPIHYLENEFLSFNFCTNKESKDVVFNLVCKDNEITSLEVNEFFQKQGCYFSNFDLKTYTCDDFDLEVSYNFNDIDKKLKRSFTKQKQSLLINHILKKDSSTLNDEDLSYYLIVLNDIQDKNNQENQEIYEKLKENRNNAEKCWPSTSCDIQTTSKILRNLKIASYDMNTRMLDDGKYYLEKNTIKGQKNIDEFRYEIYLEFDDKRDNDCVFNIDGSKEANYDYDEDDNNTILELEGLVKDEFEFVCEERTDEFNLKIYDELIFEKDYVFDTEDGKFEIKIKDHNDGYDEGETFLFKIKIEEFNAAEDDVDCKLTIDGDSVNYNFQDDDKREDLIIEKEAEETIVFTCEKEIDKIKFMLYHEELLDKNFDLEFKLEDLKKKYSSFTCIGKGDECDYYMSLDSVTTYTNLEEKSEIDIYIDNFIVGGEEDEETSEKYITFVDSVLDTSKYLYYKTDSKMIEYLKFNQNNDGSWGTGGDTNKIFKTSWGVMGLQKSSSNSENVDDGQKWIYYNEPTAGWGTVEKNALAYLAIKEKLKPYVKFSTKNVLRGETQFVIENPTIYELKDLKITFTNKLEDQLSYLETLGDFSGQEFINFTIVVNEDYFGAASGEMEITGVDGKNQKITLLKIPISVKGRDIISQREDSKLIQLSAGNYQAKINLDMKEDDFTGNCNFVNPITSAKESILIDKANKVVKFMNLELKGGNFSFDLTCTSGKETFAIPIDVEIQIVDKTVESLTPSVSIRDSKDFMITIKNTNNERQVFEFSIDGNFLGVVEPVESTKILAKNETRDIYFKFIDESLITMLQNTSKGNIIIKTENGYIEKIPLNFSTEVEKSSMMWYYIGIGFFVFVGIIFVVRRYRMQQNEEENFNANKNNHDDMFFDENDLDFK